MDEDATSKFIPAFAIFALLSLLALYFTVSHARSRSWPTVPGHLGKSDYETITTIRATGTSEKGNVLLHYTYAVDGKDYEGKVGFETDDEGRARVEQMRAQPDLTIHFNPKDPGDSWVDGDRSAMPLLLLFDALAGGMLAFAIWKWKQATAKRPF